MQKLDEFQIAIKNINRYIATHGENPTDITDDESRNLRKALCDYVSEDKIKKVADEYSGLYIQAVKQYLETNGFPKYTKDNTQDKEKDPIKILFNFFEDKSYESSFFPDFIDFIIDFIMNAKQITNKPKCIFVPSGHTFAQYDKNASNDSEMKVIDETAYAYYDSDDNIIYYKADKIMSFDLFMEHLSHEISHAIDFLDATKGAIGNQYIQKWCDKLYKQSEEKNNPEEKSAWAIGHAIGKNFTQKLKKDLLQEVIGKEK